MTYRQIQDLHQARQSKMFKDLGVFFAFGQEQFDKALKKYNLKENELTTFAGGGLLPKVNAKKLISELNRLMDLHVLEVKTLKASDVIEYELGNHECYYTGDIDSAYQILKAFDFTRSQVAEVYYDTREANQC